MKKKLFSILCIILVCFTAFSSFFAVASSAKTVTDLKKPENVELFIRDRGIVIAWAPDAVSQYYQHLVYRSESGKAGTWTCIAKVDKYLNTYMDSTAKVGNTYYYTVKAYLKDSETSVTHISENSGKHKITYRPATVYFNFFGNSGKGFLMKWYANQERYDGYLIYRSNVGKAGTWTRITNIKSGKISSFTDNKVQIGETYYYCIKGYKYVNGKAFYSDPSDKKKVTVRDLTAPANLAPVYENGKIKVKFDKVPATIGYLVYRSETGKAGEWTRLLVTKSNNITEFIDDSAVMGKKYYYTVKAYKNLNGKNLYSGNAEVAVIGPTIDCKTKDTVTIGDRYMEYCLDFNTTGIDYEDLTIYVDGDDYTHNTDGKFFEDKAITFGISRTDNYVGLWLMMKKVGESTVRVEYAQDKSIYAECKVVCVESEKEKDYIAADEKIASGLERIKQAKALLEEGYDESMKDTDVTTHKNFVQVKELIVSANEDFKNAVSLMEKHGETSIDYRDDKARVDKCVEKTSEILRRIDGETAYLKTLSFTINSLGSIQ